MREEYKEQEGAEEREGRKEEPRKGKRGEERILVVKRKGEERRTRADQERK